MKKKGMSVLNFSKEVRDEMTGKRFFERILWGESLAIFGIKRYFYERLRGGLWRI